MKKESKKKENRRVKINQNRKIKNRNETTENQPKQWKNWKQKKQ